MPSITLHPKPLHPSSASSTPTNPLPHLLQTPSGLAVVEVQGTFNLPCQTQDEDEGSLPHSHDIPNASHQTTIGRLVFPLHDSNQPDDTAWMKRVYLYVGKHQRMTGEVKKLLNPLAVIRKRQQQLPSTTTSENTQDELEVQQQQDDLEIVDIVRYKILFANRPEPVGVEQF